MAKSIVTHGAEIDGFLVGDFVHSGGMATLWSVTRPDIAVPLLMKIPRISEGEDPAAIVSFEMEQMILPRLSGPHVPACFGTGDFARQPYVVIERIPGATLYQRIPDLPLACEEAATLVGKIAVALGDLHRENVIHHDIKPSSIMFRDSGEAVLIDYGLSHHNQLPDSCRRNSACLTAPRPIWRRNGCLASATIRAAICFRWACSCISSPRACGRSARPKPCAA
jgi:serine/threonine protein kinase